MDKQQDKLKEKRIKRQVVSKALTRALRGKAEDESGYVWYKTLIKMLRFFQMYDRTEIITVPYFSTVFHISTIFTTRILRYFEFYRIIISHPTMPYTYINLISLPNDEIKTISGLTLEDIQNNILALKQMYSEMIQKIESTKDIENSEE